MIWSDDYADKKYSEMIRLRDPVCKRCRFRPAGDCSHYYERHHSGTRFNPDNGDGVCRPCHVLWEGRKNGYKEYKLRQIGKKRLEALDRLVYQETMKRSDAIIQFMELYKKTHESKREEVLP